VNALAMHGARTLDQVVGPGPHQRILESMGPTARQSLLEAVRLRLGAEAGGPPVPAPPPATPPKPRTGSAASIPPTRAELEDWARSHGVLHLLSRDVMTLRHLASPPLRRDMDMVAGGTIRDILAGTGAHLAYLGRHRGAQVVDHFRGEAWDLLRQLAHALEPTWKAIREQEAAWPPVASDATSRKLVSLLTERRDRLREKHGPLPPPKSTRVQPVPGSRKVMVVGHGLEDGVVVDLEGWEAGTLDLGHRSAVAARHGPDCTHHLMAVDVLLREVRARPDGEAATWLRTVLDQPAWARDLDALANFHAGRAGKRNAQVGGQLSWVVGVHAGEVVLHPRIRTPLAKGGWSAGTLVSLDDVMDHPGVALLPGESRALAIMEAADVGLRGASDARALEALAGNPRIFLDDDPQGTPVAVRVAHVTLTVLPADRDGDGWRVVPAVEGRALEVPEDGPEWATPQDPSHVAHLDRAHRVITVTPVTSETWAMARFLRQRRTVFPAEATEDLLRFTGAIQASMPVALPPSLRGDLVEDAREVVVRLTPAGDLALRVEVLCRALAGGPAVAPGQGGEEAHGVVEGRRVYVRRDKDREVEEARGWVERLALPGDTEDRPFVFALGRGEEALDLLGRLREVTSPHLVVEWDREPWTVTRDATPRQLKVEVGRKRDWFGMEGELEVDGVRVGMAVLMDALRHKQKYVRVSATQFVALGDQIRQRLMGMATAASVDGKGVTLGPAAVLSLEELATELGSLQVDDAFGAFLSRLRASRSSDPTPPQALAPVLRPYQVEGFRWVSRLAAWGAGACLADDMGLGKTLQALAVLGTRAAEGPALVLAPTSVCRNWVDEAARFLPSLRLRLYREVPEAKREEAVAAAGPSDVVVVSYGMFVREADRLAGRPWATLVLDEAHAVKNAATRRATAARRIQAGFRLALTGTPLENRLGELWSLFRVIFPGLFGSWEEFRDRFATPIERNGDQERRAALAAMCRPFLLRRTKLEVAPELPPRTEMTVVVEPSAGEQRLYEDARLAAVARLSGLVEDSDEKKRFETLAALTKLRLCACHPKLYDPSCTLPSSKLGRLAEIMEELADEGHRALVFSQFTSLLALVREDLDRRKVPYLYLDGATPAEKRDHLVKLFQSGQGGGVFLISLKAGGTGLNLTAATYVIHLDPWWNPAVEDQASDRAHRIGQLKPVTVVRLVTRGTVEQQILEMHQDKRALVAGVLEGADTAARLSTDELVDLIRLGSAATAEEDEEQDPAQDTPPDPSSPAPKAPHRGGRKRTGQRTE
jgi:superfamily II DNA or RNA helicase